MSSSGDISEVSKDKHEDLRKVEYFCEAINTIEGRKEKRKPKPEDIRKFLNPYPSPPPRHPHPPTPWPSSSA